MISPLNIRIGFFLALRQVKRSSKWTSSLIIFIMILTFLNLVIVSGILVGLIQGAVEAVREQYTSDVIISNLSNKTYIEHSPEIIAATKSLPQVEAVTARYMNSATFEIFRPAVRRLLGEERQGRGGRRQGDQGKAEHRRRQYSGDRSFG